MGKFKTLLLAQHHVADRHPTHVAVKQFTDNVSRRTNGEITFATVPNSKLGDMQALIRLVIDGEVDMALPPQDRIGNFAHKFGCANMPFLFADQAHADRVIDGEFLTWAARDLDAFGLVCLGHWELGFRQITNSCRPILVPADVRGLKIRVPPVVYARATILALGATPVMVEYAQLPGIIKQGLIDGQENPVSVIHALALPASQKYLSLLDYSYSILVHVINRNSFASLTDDQQIVVREESRLAGELSRQLARAQLTEQLAWLASQGMRIDRPDPAPFKALMEPVYLRMAEAFGAANMRAFCQMAEDQRQAAPAAAQ